VDLGVVKVIKTDSRTKVPGTADQPKISIHAQGVRPKAKISEIGLTLSVENLKVFYKICKILAIRALFSVFLRCFN